MSVKSEVKKAQWGGRRPFAGAKKGNQNARKYRIGGRKKLRA